MTERATTPASRSVAGQRSAAVPWAIFQEPAMIPERGEVSSYVVIVEGRKFQFLPPGDWTVSSQPRERVVALSSPDRGAAITIRFGLPPGPSGALAFETGRRWIAERWPDAELLREQTCFTAGPSGIAFDLSRKSGGLPLAQRVAWIGPGETPLEFILSTSPEEFPKRVLVFSALLTSWRGGGGLP